jgi:hypothetical protein
MINFDTLALAKSYLCWEKFTDLTIQLVPIQNAVGYFFPPFSKDKTIIIHYSANNKDVSEALFLLFHEAGHVLQFENKDKSEKHFYQLINQPNGKERANFEREAWNIGGDLFSSFVTKQNLSTILCKKYKTYAQKAYQSYHTINH